MENLDSRLLNSREEEGAAARQLKEKKRGQADETAGAEAGSDQEPQSFIEKIQAARQALNLKERARKKVEEKIFTPVRAATSRALQWAWKALIPTWGLSSIWINVHVFLKYVFGEKFFCKLGEEWLPKQATDAAGGAGKVVNKSLGLVEIMVLIFLDLIIFFIIVGFVSLFTDESTFKAITGEANKNQAAPAIQQAK